LVLATDTDDMCGIQVA